METRFTFDQLCGIMDTLLGENGCPWDKAQTHESILTNLLEESYEVVDAINNKNTENLQEELGDLLLQVLLHSKIAQKEQTFTIDDVIDGLSRKMIRRHPHVFGDEQADGQQQALNNWEKIKQGEKGFANHTEALNNVPKALPALMRAEKVVKRAVKSGVDINQLETPLADAVDGMADLFDLGQRLDSRDSESAEAIIGRLLLLIVTISVKLRINSEFALTNALEQFINRFEHLEIGQD